MAADRRRVVTALHSRSTAASCAQAPGLGDRVTLRAEGRAPGPRDAACLSRRERETLAAFARALLPRTRALPPAEQIGGVAVVEAAERLLAQAPSRTRALVRLTLRALEHMPFPRRFSRLSEARAAALLAAMASSRFALRRDMLLALKTLAYVVYASDARVQASVGARVTCVRDPVVAAAATPRPEPLAEPLRREQLSRADGSVRCDVVVVGSGAGGASAARVLAEHGLDVVVLERGPFRNAADYSTDPLAALGTLYREAGMTFCEGRPAIPLPVGRCVGGTTVINSGTCLRPPSDVMTRWRERHGIEWAADLDAEFAAVERAVGVSPVDPQHCGRNAALCRAGAEALGWRNGPLRRNAPGVTSCSSCPTGCAIDAKLAMHVSELPRAVAAGARVCAETTVEHVLVERGRAVGVSGRGFEIRADAVVLAAGALGTPELLMAQRLVNGSGAVGRNLRVHPVSWVGAYFEQPVRSWEGVMQSWSVDAFSDRRLFLEATATPVAFGAHLGGVGAELQERIARYEHLAFIGVHLSELASGRVTLDRRGRLHIRHHLCANDAQALRFGIARAAEIHVAAGAHEVYPQLGHLGALRGEELDRIERTRVSPAQLRLEAFHPMGTARMDADARRGVVAASGETHDLPGLFIADSSIFPTSLGVNPMLTVMACARRVATQLASQLG
jgi:choline dehydrogenase-like flavoprotein